MKNSTALSMLYIDQANQKKIEIESAGEDTSTYISEIVWRRACRLYSYSRTWKGFISLWAT